MPDQRKFRWVVEFTVAKCWVEDGFDLTAERAKDMLAKDLYCADGSELKARIISKPRKADIKKAQGY